MKETESTTGWSIRMDRALLIVLILGVVVLVGALLAIFVQLDWAYAEIERTVFTTERETGFLIDKLPLHQRGDFYPRVSHAIHHQRLAASGVGLLGVLLLGWATRRIGRWSEARLGLIAWSVLLPVVVGLIAGLLSLRMFDRRLEELFEALTGRSLPTQGHCMRMLTPCSHVQAIELIWTLTVAITGVVTAVIFVLAARRAWAIGERGTTLPRGWAMVAMALFGLGAVSLIASTPYAADHGRTARECSYERDLSIPNRTSTDLHVVMVDRCDAKPWVDVRPLINLQVFPDGWVSALSYFEQVEFFTPSELAARLRLDIEHARDTHGEPPSEFPIALYIDERTSATAIREHLRAARAAGVTTIVLYGQVHIEGSLETVGSWTRRGLCPIATIHFEDDDAFELSDFETWGEIITRASELDPEPLRLRP